MTRPAPAMTGEEQIAELREQFAALGTFTPDDSYDCEYACTGGPAGCLCQVSGTDEGEAALLSAILAVPVILTVLEAERERVRVLESGLAEIAKGIYGRRKEGVPEPAEADWEIAKRILALAPGGGG